MNSSVDLSDLGGTRSYDLTDLGGSRINVNPPGISQQILNQIQQEQNPPVQQRVPQMQEQFSNPTQVPGFENLPLHEQLQRIELSQWNPANETPTGSYVQPGTYENPIIRKLASTAVGVAPTLAMPGFSVGEGLISRYLVNPLLNSLARIGTGTAGAVTTNLSNVNNMQDLSNLAQSSATQNAILEGATLPFRIPGYFAEMYNPMNFAQQKAQQIQDEYNTAKQSQREAYNLPISKYGNDNVTFDPENYLNFTDQQKRYFTPAVNKLYTTFSDEPTFNNLHLLQSKMGADSVKASDINQSQALAEARDIATNKIQNYLSQDKPALDSYNNGVAITRDIVSPYNANKKLSNIATGVNDSPTPSELSNAINQGTQKVIRKDENGNPVVAVPNQHPLINHLNDINTMTNFGKLAENVVPMGVGTLGAELLNPGIMSSAAGLGAGATYAKYASPSVTSAIQNPLLQDFIKRIKPYYYGIGRATINQNQ